MTRIIVVGDLMTDAIARADGALIRGSDTSSTVTTHGGGSGANIAAWLATCGADTAFVARRGSDNVGRTRDIELMGYGVDGRMVMDGDLGTGNCVIMVTHKGDATTLSDAGANDALVPEDLPKDLFTPSSHLHLSGYALLREGSRRAATAALDRARKQRMSISVDGGSFAPLERMGAKRFLEATGHAKLCLLGAEEAKVLTGRDDPGEAAGELARHYPQVVVKLGKDGALWLGHGKREPVRVAAEPADTVVDGTGAGDAFCAGFLPPWLDGKPPADALSAGCRLAVEVMHHPGARPAT